VIEDNGEVGVPDSESGEQVLAILSFHKIGRPPADAQETWFYVSEATFGSFLSQLRQDDWHVIDLQTFLAGLAAPASLPTRSALLTFDDGYRSMRQIALPWLLRFGYPGVVFVPTDFIGGCNDFDAGIEPPEAICDWDDLRELERQGVSVQSHGASHRRFSELAAAELDDELRRSKATLEAGLGKPVEVIAYPYGDGGADPSAVERALQRTGYRAACLYGGGPNRAPVDNPYRLARLAIGPDTDLKAALHGT
jgi:peptidoglycan/xylan/chitin deacetylase (PgdA/CDA1 family)